MAVSNIFDGNILHYSHFYPGIYALFAPPCHLLWLTHKKKKLVKIFRTIIAIEAVTGHMAPDPSIHISWALVVIMFIHFTIYVSLLLPSGSLASNTLKTRSAAPAMSSIRVVDPPRRGLDEVIGKTFKLSRFLFTFPFDFSRDYIDVSYKHFFLSLIVVGCNSTVSILFAKDIVITIPDPKLIQSSFYFPIIFTVIPVCNLAWLLYRKKKIVDFFKIIRNVETVTGYCTPDTGTKMISLSAVLLVCNLIAFHRFTEVHFLGACMLNLSILSFASVLAQFKSLISAVKSQYQHILDTLDHGTAERWCCCREELGKCCRDISVCYAPQLLMIVTTNFVGIVCNAYHVAVSAVIQSNLLFAVMTKYFPL
ncbi:unnamed protein product [Nezara viridula]|uniref:Uncharacterized protein n=1 Tax=Nezara viridula TaxID=85310 RepID=A0A9P0MQD1_NEZVI|nr:unnamed protein product [Nezara viridula]